MSHQILSASFQTHQSPLLNPPAIHCLQLPVLLLLPWTGVSQLYGEETSAMSKHCTQKVLCMELNALWLEEWNPRPLFVYMYCVLVCEHRGMAHVHICVFICKGRRMSDIFLSSFHLSLFFFCLFHVCTIYIRLVCAGPHVCDHACKSSGWYWESF